MIYTKTNHPRPIHTLRLGIVELSWLRKYLVYNMLSDFIHAGNFHNKLYFRLQVFGYSITLSFDYV